MRVAHVVNLVDEVGSYGGPLRVAANQVAELRRRGHHAVLLAGRQGHLGSGPLEGASTRLWRSVRVVPVGGFASRWAPGLHSWLLRYGRSFDIVHVHLGRDLTTAPAAMLLSAAGRPYVVQTHGMVDPSGRPLAKLLDTVMVRRVMARARRVLVLSERERHDVEAVMAGRAFRCDVLPNGMSLPRVTTTSSGSGLPEVLFLSRLHARKRPVLFAEAALRLRAAGIEARFTLVGPDEGELDAVRAVLETQSGADDSVRYEGPVPMSRSVDRIADATVFVMPSVDEPFSMVVLEAMSASVPVVCSASCGLASWVERAQAGIVVPDDDLDSLMQAVQNMLENPGEASECGRRGREIVDKHFSIGSVIARLEKIYAESVAN